MLGWALLYIRVYIGLLFVAFFNVRGKAITVGKIAVYIVVIKDYGTLVIINACYLQIAIITSILSLYCYLLEY